MIRKPNEPDEFWWERPMAALTSEELATLNPDDARSYADLYADWLTLQSPAAFAVDNSRGFWQPYKHLLYLSQQVTDMVDNDTCDLLINQTAVRTGKSQFGSIQMPAWYLCRYPERRVMLVGYEADFARGWGRQVREYLADIGSRYGVAVSKVSSAADRWDIENHRGGMVTAGVGGRIIGLGGDLICIDDPTKNWEEAYSKVQRDAAWDWWQGTLMSRREPGAKMLLTMSRWHVDDIVGRLLKGDQGLRIKVIHMPALAEENDVLGRKPGEPLVPERYNEKDYETIRKAVGNRVWAAQFQQNPLPESGQILNAKKVRHYQPNRTNGELQYPLQDVTFSERDCVRIAVMDTAQTIKKSSDYTAIGIYDITPHSDVVLVDMLRLKAESPDHFALLEHAEATYQPAYFVIEREKGSIPLIQEAQRRGKAVVEINPIGDKRLRGMQAAPKIEAGKFWVPHGAPWVGDFMEELASYPSGVHDDMADTAVYAILHTNQANLAGKKPIRRDLSTPWSRFVSAAFAVKKENKDSDLMGRM